MSAPRDIPLHVRPLRLGVNVDHVATVRNARGGALPCPVRAAQLAVAAGADGITAHLREDRRHIRDEDIARLRAELNVPLNFEMAASDEMLEIALRTRPHACCLVPEKREERTTEGGLDVIGGGQGLANAVRRLRDAGIRVSLFIEPDRRQIETAKAIGAPVIELHTGTYCHASDARDIAAKERELARIIEAATFADSLGIEVHAGHGLAYDSTGPIAAIPQIAELNIGHFLIGEAIFSGLAESIRRMRSIMNASREAAAQAGR